MLNWVLCQYRCTFGTGGSLGQVHANRRGDYLFLWLCNNCKCNTCIFQERGYSVCVSAFFRLILDFLNRFLISMCDYPGMKQHASLYRRVFKPPAVSSNTSNTMTWRTLSDSSKSRRLRIRRFESSSHFVMPSLTDINIFKASESKHSLNFLPEPSES